jgi:hypothetical protein
MKKLLRIALILAGLGLIAAALVWKFYINKPHEDIENATPAYSMSAEQLWIAYTSDMKTADSLYNGKVIELSGILNRTDKSDSLVYAVFVMEIDSMFGDKSVRCEMLQKFAAETSQLSPDVPVKIKGFCTGFDGTDIKFNKSVIIK